MKTTVLNIIPLLFLLVTLTVSAQDLIQVKHSCSFDGEETNEDFYVFNSSSEADQIVGKIVGAVGLAKNFVVKSADCKNALATKEGNQRYILYNTSFLEDFKKDARTKWAAYCVLAHEIGHHLNGHDFESTESRKRKKMELEADVFAGGVLYTLGASLEEAKAGIEQLQNKGESNTHPPARAREEAIANGWKNSQEHHRDRNAEPDIIDDRSGRDPDPSTLPKKKVKEPDFSEFEDKDLEPVDDNVDWTQVSDYVIASNLVGTWQMAYYNNYGQYVTVQSYIYANGNMTEQTYINGIITATNYFTWGVSNKVLTIMDQVGYYYTYNPLFYGTNTVVLTFTGSNNTVNLTYGYGTQLTYNRIQ